MNANQEVGERPRVNPLQPVASALRLRRANSHDDFVAAFYESGYDTSAKARLYCRTSDDSAPTMPPSWRRTAFQAVSPVPSKALRVPMPPSGAVHERMAVLDHAADSIGKYDWVRNDENPWTTFGTRARAGDNMRSPNYLHNSGQIGLFSNTFRAWLQSHDVANFDTLPETASMNCGDFVLLCIAKATQASPKDLACVLNSQCNQFPHPTRWGERFNLIGSALRKPFDRNIFPGDLAFWETRDGRLQHVAILDEVEPHASVIQLSDAHDASSIGVSHDWLTFEDALEATYVPFDVATRTFVAYVNRSTDFDRRLPYAAGLAMLPRPRRSAPKPKV